ncbi:MAG TPA: oligosaccharide flippase family protein [Bacteroidota bacterium]|nr:oligosaccharide flippase family protein [Bacteroidota bacterium]
MSEVQIKEYPWQVGLRFFQGIVQVFFLLILARSLPPIEFGLFAIVSIFTTVCGIIVEFGIGTALLQRDEVSVEQLSSVFWIVLPTSLLVAGVVFAAADSLEAWFKLPELGNLLRVAIWVVPLIASQIVPRALLSRRFDFRLFATIDAVGTAFGVAVALVVLRYTASAWVFVVQILATSLIRTVWLWMAVRWVPSIRFRLKEAIPLFRFGKHVAFFNVLNFSGKYFDDGIVGKVLGAFSLGLYNLSYKVITFQQEIISGVMNQMVLPVYARNQTSREKVFDAFCRDTQFITTLSLPVLALVFSAAPLLVPLLIGDKWLPAVPVIQLLTLEAMRQSLLSLAGSALLSVGDSARFLLYAVISAPVLICSFLLGVQWGILGVAICLLVFNSALMGLMLFLLRRSFSSPLKPMIWQWIPGIVISLAVTCVAYPLVGIGLRIGALLPFAAAAIPAALCVAFVVLRSFFPVALRLAKGVRLSVRPTHAQGVDDMTRTRRAIVYVEPLVNAQNPHLTSLHSAVGTRHPGIEMRSLDFREFFLSLPKHWYALLRRSGHRPDRECIVLHFHFLHRIYASKSGIAAFLRSVRFLLAIAVCRCSGIKIAWTFHNERAHDAAHRRVERFFLFSMATMSDAILSLSLAARRLIWEEFGRSEGVVYTPHPHYRGLYADSVQVRSARRRLRIGSRDRVYLFFGTVLPYKGLLDLIESFSEWRPKRSVRLLVVGQCSDPAYERSLRDAAAGDARIAFEFRRIPDDEVQLYMRAADFGVLPFRETLHSGTAMLFSSFECPLIVPNLGWFPEIFDEHTIGIMYDHSVEGGLKSALETSLTHSREEYGPAIGEFCRERTIERAADATAMLYENLAHEA